MEKYIVKGGNPLVGEVVIGGAKNAALGILAAAVMTDGNCHIDNIPDVSDINVMLQAIEGIGGTVVRINPHEVMVSGNGVGRCGEVSVDNEYVRKMRASYYFLGALLGKCKKAHVALPGGCQIGSRPIDLHLKGFEALGATVNIENGMVNVEADRLVGNNIYMDVVSVGATINIMMAAVMAEGKTTIENAAKEPHIVDVANFLNSMGANIRGAGTDVIRIRGVEFLHSTQYSVIPDQIEAGTFMVAAAATKGDILVRNIIPKHMQAISAKLKEIGAQVEEYDDAIRVSAAQRLRHTNIKTLPYPGFPTDMQPQIGMTLTLSKGTSIITETIFENRFKYFAELTRMGANVHIEGNTAIIDGVEKLTGAQIRAHDLRAGAALVIAGLAADGFTEIDEIEYIQRGYEDFEGKLRMLGAQISRASSEEEIRKFKWKVG